MKAAEVDFEFNVILFTAEIAALLERGVGFVEAVAHWCEKNDIEMETIASIIKKDPHLKQQLLENARSLNFIKKAAP